MARTRMKKVLFFIVCLFIISATAFAQPQFGGTPEENAKRQTERMTTELKLTAEQVSQVEVINLSMAKERTQLMEKAGGNFGAIQDDMQKLNDKTTEALSKILTNEQLETYKQSATQRGRGSGGGGGGRTR